MGVGVDPAQAHSLRIITSPVARKSMAKRDSRPARCTYRGHSFRPGSPCPLTFPTTLCCQEFQLKWCRCPGTRRVEFISPCCAIHSLHDCLLGESGVHVGQCQPFCNWVSPSAPCVSEPGPPKRPPTRRLLLPRTGLAHGTFDVPVTSGSGKRVLLRVATVPPPAPAVGPGPPSILVVAPPVLFPASPPSP